MPADRSSYLPESEELLTAEAAVFSASSRMGGCSLRMPGPGLGLHFEGRSTISGACFCHSCGKVAGRRPGCALALSWTPICQSFPVQTRSRDRFIQVVSRTFPVGAMAARISWYQFARSAGAFRENHLVDLYTEQQQIDTALKCLDIAQQFLRKGCHGETEEVASTRHASSFDPPAPSSGAILL